QAIRKTRTNNSRLGTTSDINVKISEMIEAAGLIILLVYPREMVLKNLVYHYKRIIIYLIL
ncbi:MAG: hypothetical protein ACJ72S_17550, partial [Nitrososphaeraceae archaeon]